MPADRNRAQRTDEPPRSPIDAEVVHGLKLAVGVLAVRGDVVVSVLLAIRAKRNQVVGLAIHQFAGRAIHQFAAPLVALDLLLQVRTLPSGLILFVLQERLVPERGQSLVGRGVAAPRRA